MTWYKRSSTRGLSKDAEGYDACLGPSCWRKPKRKGWTLDIQWQDAESFLSKAVTAMIVAWGVFAWFPAGYGKSRAISCWPSCITSNWSGSGLVELRGNVCAIAGVDQVVRILTPYEARSRSPGGFSPSPSRSIIGKKRPGNKANNCVT